MCSCCLQSRNSSESAKQLGTALHLLVIRIHRCWKRVQPGSHSSCGMFVWAVPYQNGRSCVLVFKFQKRGWNCASMKVTAWCESNRFLMNRVVFKPGLRFANGWLMEPRRSKLLLKWNQSSKWLTPGRYGGHLRPYLSVTCDPTPLKPETRSLATLPLFTAPTTQNYTWSLATLPTTTRENTTRSLATLPTQIGRVTSDH